MDINNEQPKPRRGRPPKPKPLNPPPPRPVGRPRMTREEKKSTHIPLRLVPAEHQQWKELADAEDMPLNAYIIRAVHDWIRRKGGKK